MRSANTIPLILVATLRVAVLISSSASNVFADDATQLYANPALKFELRYPSSLVPTDPHNSAAPLLLLSQGSTYPSFNVVVEPQALSAAELTLNGQADRVNAAYRQLGLTDVRLLEQREISLNGQPAFSFRLSYGSKGQNYTSVVTIIPRVKFLYTMTFIDSSAGYATSRNLLQVILDSFASSDGAAAQAVAEGSGLALYSSVVLLCLAFLIAFALRRRRRMMPS